MRYEIIFCAFVVGCNSEYDDMSDCAGDSSHCIGTSEQAATSLAGVWTGWSVYVGPPGPPVGGPQYNHDTTVTVGCDGAEGTATYYYPYFDVTCHSVLVFDEQVDPETARYTDVTQTDGCVDGVVTLEMLKTDGGLRHTWQMPPSAPEPQTSVGFLKRIGTVDCD